MEINEANIMAVTQDKKTKESNIPSIETDVPQAEETVEIQPPKMGKQPTYMNGAKLYLTFTAYVSAYTSSCQENKLTCSTTEFYFARS